MTRRGRVTDRRRTIITAALRTPVRLLLPVLLVVFAGTLLLAPDAMADFLSPEDGTDSPNAEAIDNLYWILFGLSCVVFAGVEGALIYSLFKFRARKGAVPAQIRGNTRLEIGWTVGAAVILVIIAIVTFIQLDEIRTAPNTDQSAGLQLPAQNVPGETGTPDDRSFPRDGRALRIKVNGQQYVWRYTYPDGDDNTRNDAFDYETLVVPTDTTVTLEITAQDVAHSWWIPDAGGKFDAVPGHKNYTWLNIPGKMAGKTWRGQCAELCGRNHANMIAHLKAVTPDEYVAYIQRRKREIAGANESAAEQRREIEGQN
jgi:cytochrome c oxidase subunit 2